MAGNNAPSEFGGGPMRRNRIQPPPHQPTASEKLMLQYTTGDPTGVLDPDLEGAAFEGLLPYKQQEEIRRAAGDLDKGQVWDELVQKGEEPPAPEAPIAP